MDPLGDLDEGAVFQTAYSRGGIEDSSEDDLSQRSDDDVSKSEEDEGTIGPLEVDEEGDSLRESRVSSKGVGRSPRL